MHTKIFGTFGLRQLYNFTGGQTSPQSDGYVCRLVGFNALLLQSGFTFVEARVKVPCCGSTGDPNIAVLSANVAAEVSFMVGRSDVYE